MSAGGGPATHLSRNSLDAGCAAAVFVPAGEWLRPTACVSDRQSLTSKAFPRTVSHIRSTSAAKATTAWSSRATVAARAWSPGLSTDEVKDTISRLSTFSGAVALIGVLGAGVAGLFIVRRQMRPLRQVAATARSVAQMPLSTGEVDEIPRVPDTLVDPETEVGQVGEAFNSMLGHVEQSLTDRHESEQQLRQFLADASHELRTPLTTIQGYAELTRRADMATLESLQLAMGKVQVESTRMATLGRGHAAAGTTGRGTAPGVDGGGSRLISSSRQSTTPAWSTPTRRYQVSLPDTPLVVRGDEHRLHQVVSNLLNNARRHTPPGTTVMVAGRSTEPDHRAGGARRRAGAADNLAGQGVRAILARRQQSYSTWQRADVEGRCRTRFVDRGGDRARPCGRRVGAERAG